MWGGGRGTPAHWSLVLSCWEGGVGEGKDVPLVLHWSCSRSLPGEWGEGRGLYQSGPVTEM